MSRQAKVAVCSENTQTECNHHVEFVNVKTGCSQCSWQTLKVTLSIVSIKEAYLRSEF